MTLKSTGAVEAFLADLEHPRMLEIVALRQVLLSADPAVSEDIKWNAPSFRTAEHFATMQLRSKHALQLILHLGARKRALPAVAIVDPDKLLTWLGPDRASVSFTDADDLAAKRNALLVIVRQWLRHV